MNAKSFFLEKEIFPEGIHFEWLGFLLIVVVVAMVGMDLPTMAIHTIDPQSASVDSRDAEFAGRDKDREKAFLDKKSEIENALIRQGEINIKVLSFFSQNAETWAILCTDGSVRKSKNGASGRYEVMSFPPMATEKTEISFSGDVALLSEKGGIIGRSYDGCANWESVRDARDEIASRTVDTY